MTFKELSNKLPSADSITNNTQVLKLERLIEQIKLQIERGKNYLYVTNLRSQRDAKIIQLLKEKGYELVFVDQSKFNERILISW